MSSQCLTLGLAIGLVDHRRGQKSKCANSVFSLGLLPWSWEVYSLSIFLVQEEHEKLGETVTQPYPKLSPVHS